MLGECFNCGRVLWLGEYECYWCMHLVGVDFYDSCSVTVGRIDLREAEEQE